MDATKIADRLLQSLEQECPGLRLDYSLVGIRRRLERDLERAFREESSYPNDSGSAQHLGGNG